MFARIKAGGTLLRKITNASIVKRPSSSASAIPTPKVIFNNLKSSDKYTPGSIYEGFLCTKTDFISDFNITAYLFKHEVTGSEYVHFERADTNNVFSINFRTTPFDSTGLPHILEHNVLCGSERFPVRDPFFKMLTRSLATFMNAMTGPDYTLYPFSSTNEIDYRNLQKIYLDAVFKPNLKYMDFKQEGWRLEHSNLKDKNSDYTIKGVVYNEMKGAFSENCSIFGQRFLNEILPDHTYRYVSGGDPLEIPKLTHEDLVNFHAKYYHPSNAKFFSYGSFDLRKSLKYVNENYLAKGERIDSNYSIIPPQKRWQQPKQSVISCRYDSMGAPIEKQNQIAIGYLMSDITNSYETLVLHVLSELLVKGPNSYFYKSLIEPNFSGGFNRLTGYDAQIRDTMFVVGLQDLSTEDFGRMQKLFDQTIDMAIERGFETQHIESVLHNIELHLKHQVTTFGLGVLFNLTPLWNHGGDVIKVMDVSAMLKELRENLRNPLYLQEKVDQYFRQNNHRLTMTMTPDKEYEEKFNRAEKELLQNKTKNLTEHDKQKIYKEGLQLAEAQKQTESIDVLPCLNLNDISKTIEVFNLNREIINNVPTNILTTDTNGVNYFKGILNGAHLKDEQKLLLPLLAEVIDQFGTERISYRDFDQLISSKTSGLQFKLHCAENVNDIFKYELGVSFESYCLEKNTGAMLDIFRELFTSFKFDDVKRFEMLLENYMSNLSIGIANSGHYYAMQACNGLLTEAGRLKESLLGIAHIEYMKNLVQSKGAAEILSQLTELAELLLKAPQLRCAINVAENSKATTLDKYSSFLKELDPLGLTNKYQSSWLLEPSCRHNIMNIPVNYCAKSFVAVPYTHKDFAPLRVLAKSLSSKYLLPVVREQNGAYGAGAKIGIDGIFNFFSYRDPNCRKTLDTFDNTYTWFNDNLKIFDEQVLFEAKLGVLQQLDYPIDPKTKGDEDFRYGITQNLFADHRKSVLGVKRSDLEEVVRKYFSKEPVKGVGKCVLGPGSSDQQKNNEKWTVSEA